MPVPKVSNGGGAKGVKRYVLSGLGILGAVCLIGNIWWLPANASAGGFGPSIFISTGIFDETALQAFATDLKAVIGAEVRVL